MRHVPLKLARCLPLPLIFTAGIFASGPFALAPFAVAPAVAGSTYPPAQMTAADRGPATTRDPRIADADADARPDFQSLEALG